MCYSLDEIVNPLHRSDSPKVLYHYTKAENLISILETNQFKISLFEKSNDFKESDSILFKNSGRNVHDFRYLSFVNDDGLYGFKNETMWNFYADSSRGVCLEVNRHLLKDLIGSSIIKEGNIEYDNSITKTDNLAHKSDGIEIFLMQKRTCWSYEKEYRFLLSSDIENVPTFAKCLSGIYFGPMIKDENKKKIINMISEKNNQTKLYNLSIDKYDGRLIRTICREIKY